jgi:hypothetical protein
MIDKTIPLLYSPNQKDITALTTSNKIIQSLNWLINLIVREDVELVWIVLVPYVSKRSFATDTVNHCGDVSNSL